MKIPEAYQIRVFQEHAELKERLSKLLTFVNSSQLYDLDLEEQKRLIEQTTHMSNYLNVLTARIKAM